MRCSFGTVWVRGEVANLSRPASGHAYFTLRDGTAALRCVMFRDGFGADLLESGSSLIAHGRVTLYEPRGDLQLVADVVNRREWETLQLRWSNSSSSCRGRDCSRSPQEAVAPLPRAHRGRHLARAAPSGTTSRWSCAAGIHW